MKTRIFIALVCFTIIQDLTPLRAELPPDAQEAVKKGIIAAKEQDYLLAIRYFQDARKIAPTAPEIYLNLGLAESKIPSRELRAICWFGAYLAARPDAPNAAAVKDQIETLDVKSVSNISHLIQTEQQNTATSFHPYLAGTYGQWYDDVFCVANIAKSWAGIGDYTTAFKIANQYTGTNKDIPYRNIAVAQARVGDIKSAQKTADLIGDAEGKNVAQSVIVDAQLKAGDIAGAQKTANLMTQNYNKDDALKNIATAQAMSGDIDGARETAGLISKEYYKNDALGDIEAVRKQMVLFKSNLTDAIQAANAQGIYVCGHDWLYWLNYSFRSPGIKSADWLRLNDGDLNAAPFLDLASYLTSQKADDLDKTEETLINEQNTIDLMLKKQAKEQAQQTKVKAMDDGEYDVHKSGDTPHIPPPPPPPQ